jgi:hypothetical protein
MVSDENIVLHTREWINKVVVGLNFCPFAAKEVKRGSIHYVVTRTEDLKILLGVLSLEFDRLDMDNSIETTLIILPGIFEDFNEYLYMMEMAEKFLKLQKKEGTYQLAGFHPEYRFSGSKADDASNYTNRSVYPMIHILREESITKALAAFPNPEKIPERNIALARNKGTEFMRLLRASCLPG